MSWLERCWLAQTLRPIVVYGWYLNRHFEFAAQGAFNGPDGLKLLGWELLLLIIATIIAGIIVQAGFVITSVATGQETIDGIDDERDKQIEARAMKHGFTATGLGFLSMVLALWQGWGLLWAVNLLLAGMVLADVTVNFYKFFRYWRGG